MEWPDVSNVAPADMQDVRTTWPPSLWFWTGHRDDEASWIHTYWTSVDKPHHLLLRDELVRRAPGSVLEVGCHCGPMFRLLHEALPTCELHGVDASAVAIAAGRDGLATEGVAADLRVGVVPEALEAYESGSLDWVYSCYALAYVEPDQIRAAVAHMARIARCGVMLFEPTSCELDRCLGIRREQAVMWVHPYLHVLTSIPNMVGCLATIIETKYDECANLNALIIVER
jgi:ubiquinone/menaquinone biosynthesis C-methylase UbiE